MGLLGKFFRFLLLGHCCKPTTTGGDSESLRPHGISAATHGIWALAYDLFNFEITCQVPEDLSQHVVSSKKAQANWYRKLVETWREAKQPPRSEEEAARLGLLDFCGLPRPHSLVKVSAGVPTSLPRGVKFEFRTLPVDAKAVPDGDGVTVYVSTADPRESSCVPSDVQIAAIQRSEARADKNYTKADELHQKIIDAGYRVLNVQNEEILARKYRIRLRGIDAPETLMPYGQEAKEELVKLLEGMCLRVLVYGEDRYGRCVADVYCNGIFAQEVMLKKGAAWHYTAYDQRSEFARWEEEARRNQIGLWASSNPEKPWDWISVKDS
ncbi:unnamed protein product [Prunus armeniaca]|uniref:TNase-like domain-containing protein n=1 Tax=Prunus armeniaca TaxID=36596 RepID=A0A6J5U614_PRUAR|nr:unnamed protein product [Prunus armeniaca]